MSHMLKVFKAYSCVDWFEEDKLSITKVFSNSFKSWKSIWDRILINEFVNFIGYSFIKVLKMLI